MRPKMDEPLIIVLKPDMALVMDSDLNMEPTWKVWPGLKIYSLQFTSGQNPSGKETSSNEIQAHRRLRGRRRSKDVIRVPIS